MKKNLNIIGLLALAIISMLFISACSLTYVPEDLNDNNSDIIDVDLDSGRTEIMYEDPESNSSDVADDQEDRDLIKYADDDITLSDVSLTITAVEGELIDLQPQVEDPDDDELELSFTGPFNDAGLWQTEDGDEGKYLITVSASDGELTTKEYILIEISARNKAPVIECPDTITVFESETVRLNCNIYDREDDTFVVGYSGWIGSKQYETNYEDEGEYSVLVTAIDELENKAQKSIDIIVKNKNRLPIIEGVEDLEAVEKDVIVLEYNAYDPDGDKVDVYFSEPFDRDGIWATKDGDNGVHEAFIKVTDGQGSTTKDFTVIVDNINTKPQLEPIPEIVVDEGDTVLINVEASDGEGDSLVITFSGWMDSDEYVTTYEDAGTHYVKVTVSDGRLETSQNVKVIVNNVNRPPVFIVPE